MKRIPIFRPGQHTASSGAELTFSEADVEAIARLYDPALHEAPIVVGHPRTDAPAYGWVEALEYSDPLLAARPRQVQPEFSDWVQQGRVKKVSAAFYPPGHPRNPVGDQSYYLRHVGFLGAQPPALAGLPPVEFADAAGDGDLLLVEFSDVDFLRAGAELLPAFFQRLREWLLERYGVEDANRVIPSFDIEILSEEGRRTEPATEFSDHHQEVPVSTHKATGPEPGQPTDPAASGSTPPTEFAEREQRLSAMEQRLALREAGLRRGAAERQVDGLIEAGQVLPRDREGLVAFMEAVETAGDPVVAFAEGDDTREVPAGQWLLEFLGRLPAQVEFDERAGGRVPTDPDDIDATAQRIAAAVRGDH